MVTGVPLARHQVSDGGVIYALRVRCGAGAKYATEEASRQAASQRPSADIAYT